LWKGEVVPGFAGAPTQSPEDTKAIAAYNQRLASHPDLITAVVPLRDGVSISVKKRT
jgi:predicted O-methyltransferase YrrM